MVNFCGRDWSTAEGVVLQSKTMEREDAEVRKARFQTVARLSESRPHTKTTDNLPDRKSVFRFFPSQDTDR